MKLVHSSENKKLGKRRMAATYREAGPTCPRDCPMLGNGCYAQRGHVRFAGADGGVEIDFEDLELFIRRCAKDRRIIRHHVSGDFMGPDGTVDFMYIRELAGLHATTRALGYGYTHAWREIPHEWFEDAATLTINASCTNTEEVREAKTLGYQTVVTVPPGTTSGMHDGVHITICPADGCKDMVCADCRLCMKTRETTIGFLSKNRTSHAPIIDAWTEEEI